MAEYKGLTIRIGGDTSQLNAALKGSTKAAASLQSQIRQITRAMRFDPGNLANVDTRMKLTTNRAEALHAKIRLLQSGYSELGKSVVSVGGAATSVKELAESTENVAMAASIAKERYNDMTATLASRYRELEARAKAAGESMNLNALSRQGTDDTFEKQMAKLRELGVVTDEEIQKLRKMRATWNEAFDSSEAYKAASQLEGMKVDMQRFESEAKGATATVRELNTVSKYSADTWQESTARVKAMDSALSECAKQARAYEAALREDPSNVNAAIGRLKALAGEYDLAKDKAGELSAQVQAYEARLSETLAREKNLPQFIKDTGDAWQKVQGELSQAKGEAAALHQSLQRLEDMQAPVEEIRQLKAQVSEADARVDALKASADGMNEVFETSKECAELQRLQSELAQTESHAKSVKQRMDLSSLGGKSLLNASTVKSAGMTLYSTLTPAITMLGWRTVTAAQEMDSAYRDMRKTVEGTETQFEELRRGAIEFSKTHVTSAAQLLEIESIGGELGVATENLQKFAETVSNIEVATNYDTEGAATALGQLANITHMTADEYEGFSDALVRLGNNGASTETQIGDISTRIGSMANIVGMTVPDILAWSSTLASTGMQSEASGTAFSKTISLMETAVASAGGTMDTSFEAISAAVAEGGDKLTIFANMSGSTAEQFADDWATDPESVFEGLQSGIMNAKDSLQVIADVAHMSADDFAKTWEEDPTTALKNFIEGLNGIEESGGSADSVLGSIGITASRQKQAIEGLMQTIGLLDDNLMMSKDAWNGTSDQWGAAGDAAREAQKKAEGFSGQLSILSNIGNDAMASLADGATPVISAFTALAQAALDLFNGMDENQKTLTVVGLGIAALAGPVLTMVSTFITAKQNIAAFAAESSAMGKAMAILKSGFADAGTGADGMKLKMMSLGEAAKTIGKSLARDLAIGAVVAGVGLAISAISDYIRKMQEAEEASLNAGDVIGSALGGALGSQAGAVTDLGGSYDAMVTKMAENNRRLQSSANETYGNVALIEQYGDSLMAALDAYNAGDRSAQSMANLKTQLELYNGAAGTSISFTEDEAGALHLMKDGAQLSADAFDRLTASLIAAAKAEFFKEGYTTKMSDYRDALDQVAEAEKNVKAAQDELDRAYATPGIAPERIAQLETSLAAANKTLDDSKQKLGETTSAMNQYEEGMKLMAEAQLENASDAVKWMADNDALQASIWRNGESVTNFAHNLDGLGVSYDQLESNAGGIAEMATTWDGSTRSMISGLRSVGIEIDLSAAKVRGLNATQIDGKTYWVDDMGTVYDQQGKVIGLKDEIGSIEDGEFEVTDNWSASESQGRVSSLKDEIAGVTGKEVDVKANVYGYDSVTLLASTISGIKDKIVNIKAETGGSATGSVASSPFIPKHASGYIAKGPTLTNNGWVGEAGAEAVLNWGTGGTVVPLTNRRYMRPIAKEIAAEMGGRGRNVNVVVNLDYKAGDDANKMARDISRRITAYMNMEA